MRIAVRTAVRLLPIAMASLILALAPATPALAFSKVDRLEPVPAGRGYVYYVRETNNDHQPLAGRSVTMKLQNAPGPGATVAAADAKGHLSGPEGQTAIEASGPDGLAYFLLKTSTAIGVNEFVWDDGNYTGQVLVTGLGPDGATPSPTPNPTPPPAAAHGGSGAARGGGSGPSAAALRGRLPATRMPPIAAGVVAAGLVWLVVPGLLRRRAGGASPAVRAQPSRLPSGQTGLG
jgi:hypothetical protein